ncbi:MAG: glycosyl hydrolase [Monoraphidium minutum]|nr:MAG: glycosyl hydrolase [Monoraphidium minutum]
MDDAGHRPIFHVAPRAGWVNDPNGPFMYKGKYHLFYQHLQEGCEWGFGLVWGHAVSSDLVQWQHLPHALEPTPGALDADGCFSGCATVDVDGRPIILYTGVRLRTNPACGPLPPPERDLNLPFVESQIAATPLDPDDHHLVSWSKDEVPFLALPPPELQLTGWRDPFVVERPSAANGNEWVVLIGSGLKNGGGTCLVYRTPSLRDPASWRYDGLLCSGDGETGAVWECPLIAELEPLPPGARARCPRSHWASAAACAAAGSRATTRSPASRARRTSTTLCGAAARAAAARAASRSRRRPAASRSSCTSRRGGGGTFTRSRPTRAPTPPSTGSATTRAAASTWRPRWGPFRLDLGDALYAPNVMVDDHGRTLLWSWLQEKRTVGTYDYAGCMGVPRLLYLDADSDRLLQFPAPEVERLRRGASWRASEISLSAGAPLPLPGVAGPHLDVCLTFRRGSGRAVGVMLRAWGAGGGAGGAGGAAVVYHWEEQLLEVVFEALDPSTMQFSLTAPDARRIGGPLTARPGEPLELRLLVDGSCVEAFTGTGEVLATRVYRGAPYGAHGGHGGGKAGSGLELFALDGDAVIARAEAYEMASIWAAQDAAQRAAAEAALAAAAAAEAAPAPPAGALALDLAAAIERAQSAVASRAASRPGSLAASLGAGAGGNAALALAADRLAGLQLGLTRTASASGPLSPPRVIAGGGDAWANELGDGHMVPEEEMTADLFLLEGVSSRRIHVCSFSAGACGVPRALGAFGRHAVQRARRCLRPLCITKPVSARRTRRPRLPGDWDSALLRWLQPPNLKPVSVVNLANGAWAEWPLRVASCGLDSCCPTG